MPIAFGFSVGDFIAGINLLKDFFDALSDTHGATTDYIELRKTLDAVAKALDAAKDFTSPQHRAAVETEASGCTQCIDTFLRDFSNFELLRKGRGSTSKLHFAMLKVKWWRHSKDSVRKFRDHLQEHVRALTLQTVIFQVGEQHRTLKAVDETAATVDKLATQVATGLQLQDNLLSMAKDAHDGQHVTLSNIETQLSSTAAMVATVPVQLDDIRKGLSADQQKTLVSMLERSLTNAETMRRELQEIKTQNTTLEVHLVQMESMVRVQQDIPSQVLLRKPVVLIDPFEENRLPFHLDFINSFEALFAVFMLRFKNKVDDVLSRIRRHMFVMYEQSKQRRIDLVGPWAETFKMI